MPIKKKTLLSHLRRTRKPNQVPLAVKVKRLTKKVNKTQPEVKYADASDASFSTVTSGGKILCFSGIPQSATGAQPDNNSRIGDKIRLKKGTLHLRAFTPNGCIEPVIQMRVIVAQGHQENGTLPTVTDFIPSAYQNSEMATNSPLTWDNKSLHTILVDKTFQFPTGGNGTLSSSTLAANGESFKSWKLNFYPKGETKYIGATTSHADRGIYAMAISSVTAGAAVAPQMNWISRLTFTDA